MVRFRPLWGKKRASAATTAPLGLGYRGKVPHGTDLDDLAGLEHSGVWQILGGERGYDNLPRRFRSSQTLKVIATEHSTLQRITVRGGRKTSPGIYYRFSGMGSGSGWSEWYRTPLNPINDDGGGHLVISDAVTRIRTTTDPNEIAQAGELLIVLES